MRLKILVLAMLMTFFCVGLHAQKWEGWLSLDKMKMSKFYDDLLGEELDVPSFSQELKAFEGQTVAAEGYVIPMQVSETHEYFVLSRFPYNSCFFCGNAGPETVLEVYTKDPVPVKDEKVKVTGVLRLNATDPLHLFYILEESVVEILD